MKSSLNIKKYIWLVTPIILLFIIYEICHLSISEDIEFLVPSLVSIFKDMGIIIITWAKIKLLLNAILKTLIVIIISFFISAIFVFLVEKFKYTKYFFKILVNILKAMPFAVISIYLFVVLFRVRSVISIIVSFLVVFPICYEGLLGVVENIPRGIKDELSILPINSVKKYTDVFLPMSFPYIMVNFLQSFGLGLKVMVMAEYICVIQNSLGKTINDLKLDNNFSELLAWLILLVLITSLFDIVINIISRKLKKPEVKMRRL